jgi:hypothetical protein
MGRLIFCVEFCFKSGCDGYLNLIVTNYNKSIFNLYSHVGYEHYLCQKMNLRQLLIILCCSFGLAQSLVAQVGIGTNIPDASAKLQIDATDKGFLPPRVALTSAIDLATIASPATGLLVYCTGTSGLASGYYFWNGTVWRPLHDVTPTLNVQNGITVTATFTNPNSGARTADRIYFEDMGNHYRLKYQLGFAGSSGGSGEYLFQLPTGIQFNTAADRNPTYSGILWSPNIAAMAPYLIPVKGSFVYAGNWSNEIYIIPYSATTFRVASSHNNSSPFKTWGSDYFAFIISSMINLEFEIWK